MVEYAFRVHVSLKRYGSERLDKWILRRAAEELLPPEITSRRKMKFAAGSGLGERIAAHA